MHTPEEMLRPSSRSEFNARSTDVARRTGGTGAAQEHQAIRVVPSRRQCVHFHRRRALAAERHDTDLNCCRQRNTRKCLPSKGASIDPTSIPISGDAFTTHLHLSSTLKHWTPFITICHARPFRRLVTFDDRPCRPCRAAVACDQRDRCFGMGCLVPGGHCEVLP